MLGFAPEEFQGGAVSLLERVHRDDRELISTWFDPSNKRSSGTECVRVRHANGCIRCMESRFEWAERNGAAVVILTMQDAAQSWTALEGAAEAAEIAAQLANPELAAVLLDKNHVITAVSSRFRMHLPAALAERGPVGLTTYDICPEQDADNFYRIERQVLCDAAEVQDVVQTGSETGVRWVHVREVPVKNAGNEVIGVLALFRDMTQRILAEEHLLENVESLRESQRIAGVGSYVLDARRGAVVTSSLLDGILGIDKDYPHTVDGWRDLIHPEDREWVIEEFTDTTIGKGQLWDREYRIVRPSDGQARWVHGIGRVELDGHGKSLLVRGTIQDVTERKQIESALQEAKNRLRLFIEEAPAALAMFDQEMRYLAVSRRWLEVLGIGDEPVVGRSHYDVVPDIPERWKEAHARGMAGEALRHDGDRFDRADGSVCWLRREILPWRHDDGTVGGIVLFIDDITKSHVAEERLRLAASVFEHASEAIMVTDLEARIVEVNETFTRITGFQRDEVLGRNPRLLQSGRHTRSFFEEMWRSVKDSGRWRGELWNRTKNGSLFATMTTITTVFDSEGKAQYYLSLGSDITPIKEQERQLAHISHFDALTGLPNRVLLVERLRQAMANCGNSSRRLAVAYFDLDAFKAINDVHGHATADRLLVTVATHMKRALREGDLLARISGDEFVVVLSDLPSADAAGPLFSRLLRAVSDPIKVGGNSLQVGASAGVTFYPQSEDVDADQLLRQADQAMYVAKLSGGNRWHAFDPEEDRSARGRHEELGRLRQALEMREFVLFYQPKVNMATGELVGAEALIRWRHPERGLLPPGMFLPLLEQHDLAIDVGEWVIATALEQVEQWCAAGRRMTISVNVSARQLQHPDFVERLGALLQAHPNVDPSYLELEVLESSALQDVAVVSQVIEACRRMGMSVSIDDFGTGYSSLTYLKQLPVSVLKIDQSFVRDMLDDPDDLAILQGVMGLATAFRRLPVAEGVETVGHGVLLLKLGCQLAQGYGIAKPMPAEELLGWYEKWRPDPRWTQAVALSPSEWPLLVAEVELSAWNKAIEDFVTGERTSAPELDAGRCRFGAWVEGEKLGGHGDGHLIDRIDLLHQESHRIAKQAADLKMRGLVEEAKLLLSETRLLRDEIHGHLSLLTKGTHHEPPAKPVVQAPTKARRATAKIQ